MLTKAGCEQRQERFRGMLGDLGLGAAVLTDVREIYYLTGLMLYPAGAAARFPAVLYVQTDGASWLACHTGDGDALVDDRVTFEPSLMFTLNPDPMQRLNDVVKQRASRSGSPGMLGYQSESMPRIIARTLESELAPDDWFSIDNQIADLEKRKDQDEIDLLRRSIEATLAAYDGASAVIAPGVSELFVREAGAAAASFSSGEIVFHNGDYQCGNFGGPARDRVIEDGELYIIDAWTEYRGYWSDLCRTFAVGTITPEQLGLYDHIANALNDVRAIIEPGRTGDQIWAFLDERLRQHPLFADAGLVHHAGHGIGLRPHEAPDLNRDRGGLIEVGDVLCVEPGAYTDELRKGVRLENTFLVTEDGCELLSEYPFVLQ